MFHDNESRGAFRGAFFPAVKFSRLLFFPFGFYARRTRFILFFKKPANLCFSQELRRFSAINHAHFASGIKTDS
ncbi:MAG: hypothetical protein DI626_08580 [Micavibrio aeruginosavorus]|uniref:Uncharacterized protein n=1 Tax=Micavibrio aeruginosavorus TaxID=349221 RepID=A0A2W4ZP31_9BACT|nr:MAG: hypothetical protein DI626_08580 [Micavibrio aeruginosavorus]